MIFLLVIFFLALIVSLFFVSWRVAIWAFAIESVVAGIILMKGEGLDSWAARIQILDLAVFRAFVIPMSLIGVLQKFKTQDEFNTIPANFIIWTMALTLLIVSFTFGLTIFPTELQHALHLGIATSAILMGLFILSNQSSPIGQIVGLLTFESGIILSETLASHHEQWAIQLGLSAIFLWSMRVAWNFLQYFSKLEDSSLEVLTSLPNELPNEEKDVL